MKRIGLCVVLCVLFLCLGCKDNSKIARQKVANEKAKQERDDQIEESLSVNIWNNVKFGMSKEEVRNTKIFGDLEGDNRVYTITPTSNLGIFTRELGEVRIAFGEESGKLNFLHFISKENIYADHIDDMEEDCHKIIKVMEDGFKTKFEWKNNAVSITDFNEGKQFDILSQTYGDTHIVVSMGKKYEGSIYYYEIMASYNNPKAY